MLDWLTGSLQHYFDAYGYWTLAVLLLLENAGLPVPGETALLTASFLAHARGTLRFWLIVPIAVVAATLGDNIGYMIGRRGGRPLLDRYRSTFHLSAATLDRSEQLFARYGAFTVFFARFVTGLRVIAGPLAGILRMPWHQFVLFNFLGALTWVLVIASVGYVFSSQMVLLSEYLNKAGIALLIVAVVTFVVWWKRRR